MNAAPMLELRDITRRFEKKLDFAGRIAQRLGAPVREEVVHAVRLWGWSVNPAAANPRLGAWWPAYCRQPKARFCAMGATSRR